MTAKTRHLLAAVALVGSIVALSMVLTTKEAVAQTVLRACYVSNTGIVYRIGVAGAPDECRSSRHLEFSWTDGEEAVFSSAAPSVGQVLTWDGAWTPTASGVAVSDHGALSGLDPDDDHGQYVLANGVRGTTNGFAVTGAFLTGSIPIEGAGTRIMWYPGKSAFRAGIVFGTQWNDANIGNQSVAVGRNTTASGFASTAMGDNTTASGTGSTAMGFFATAGPGSSSTAMGQSTTASGVRSTAMGNTTTASGDNSTAMGNTTTASGDNSTAMGNQTTASGSSSTALGDQTTASGDYSTAMGNGTQANQSSSTAMGLNTTASGASSTAMGEGTTASGNHSMAMGLNTTASDQSMAMGNGATASGPASIALGFSAVASGDVSVAMGLQTTASGNRSTAMGRRASTNGMGGSFVYGDNSTSSTVNVQAINSFVVRAQEVWFGKSGDQTDLGYITTSTGAFLSDGGAWTDASSRDLKENFRDEDAEVMLAKIAELPVQSWSYKVEDPSVRHVGPTAEDFQAAFGLGDSDKAIATLDVAGVNLLAVQALEKRTAELRAENARLRERLTELEAMIRSIVGVESN